MSAPRSNHRWLASSFRALAVVVAIVAIAIIWAELRISKRKALIAGLKRRGALVVDWQPQESQRIAPMMWRVLGVRSVQWVELPSTGFTDEDLAQIADLLPESALQCRAESVSAQSSAFWSLYYDGLVPSQSARE